MKDKVKKILEGCLVKVGFLKKDLDKLKNELEDSIKNTSEEERK